MNLNKKINSKWADDDFMFYSFMIYKLKFYYLQQHGINRNKVSEMEKAQKTQQLPQVWETGSIF